VIVVSDTSPLCYLRLINQIDVLQALYGVVIIPQAVAKELSAPKTPSVVKDWLAVPPNWLQIQVAVLPQSDALKLLDPGEREAILLAEQLKADLVILDDKAARQMARERGLTVIGLLGIVKSAARSNLLDLETTFAQLREVGFWVAPSLLERLLTED
jgi:predicted nucleic acid-binding protein